MYCGSCIAKRTSPKGGGCSGKKRDRRQRSSPRSKNKRRARGARSGEQKAVGSRGVSQSAAILDRVIVNKNCHLHSNSSTL